MMVTSSHTLLCEIPLGLGKHTSGPGALQEGVMGNPGKQELRVEIMSRATCSPPLLGATESTPETMLSFGSLG